MSPNSRIVRIKVDCNWLLLKFSKKAGFSRHGTETKTIIIIVIIIMIITIIIINNNDDNNHNHASMIRCLLASLHAHLNERDHSLVL